MKELLGNNEEIFNQIARHEDLRKLRAMFDGQLGRPIWRITCRFCDTSAMMRQHLELSYQIWHDPRVRNLKNPYRVFKLLEKKNKLFQPILLSDEKGVRHYCVPLGSEQRRVGYLILTGVKKEISSASLDVVSGYLNLLSENSLKAEEVARLSAAIRPRAVALSTVHTVHRIINSTLNLDELVSRLAHLTAQVLRVERCLIYLTENGRQSAPRGRFKRRAPTTLMRKACIGYPKNKERPARLSIGHEMEGRVAKTAEIVLRKKFICVPLIDEDVIGVVTISRKKDKKEFNHFDLEILTTLAEEAVIAIKNAQLYEEQRKVTLGTIQSLAVILGMRMPANTIPPEVFLRLALRVAEKMKLDDEQTQALHYATLLKDTAKIGIPEEILKKTDKLTGEELSVLREHPIKGARIVQSFENLKSVAPIILYSREKFDGTGYPEGLRGEQIPVGARILAVINAFEAILVGRPYRDQASLTEAMAELSRNSGTQFDPKVVEAFVGIVEQEGYCQILRKYDKTETLIKPH